MQRILPVLTVINATDLPCTSAVLVISVVLRNSIRLWSPQPYISGQALCNHCRENTHRAKMFSTHDIVHMSKCSKEVHRRCAVHGEQYIMFSNSQRNMLCVNCFRDTPAEARLHCVDIDTAYTQSNKKLDRAIMSVRDVQSSVREGVMTYRNLLEELQHSTESEKLTIQSFCQGMQDAINKTQANMVLEVQRQFESKERLFKSHLMNLSTILPILQMHLLLSQGFASAANKFQFLDLAYPMMDRLSLVSQLSQPLRPTQSSQIRTNYRSEFAHSLEPWLGKSSLSHHPPTTSESSGMYEGSQGSGMASTSQATPVGSSTPTPLHPAPSRKQHSALRAKALEGEGPFSNHCRSFDTQIKEIGVQLTNVRDRLLELQRDVTLIRRAATPPLAKRHLGIARDCERLDDTLQRYHVELDRLRSVFDTLWQEQLYRIHVEQDIFRSQMNDIVSLRSEVKQLATVAQQLEPYVKTLSSQTNLEEVANLQALIDRISVLQASEQHHAQSMRSHEPRQMMSPTSDSMMYLKGDSGSKPELPVRESMRSRPTASQSQTMLDANIYGRSPQGAESRARGVISQLIEKVRIKEDRKKSPVQEEIRGPILRERSKSEGRGKDMMRSDERPKLNAPGKGEVYRVGSANSSGGASGSGKVSSLYHTISGKVMGSRESGCNEISPGIEVPPPPPARRMDEGVPTQAEQSAAALNKCMEIREHLENHLKQKLKQRNRMSNRSKELMPYQDATSNMEARQHRGDGQPNSSSVMIRALVHPAPPSPPHTVYPHSDTEDSVFYPDTPSSGRRSSMDLMDRRKTLVVVIGASGKSKARLMQKQRSWETFPPKKRQEVNTSKFCHDPDSFRGGFDLAGLKKADSFEGHEEAVRTLVAAVQETRTLRKPKSPAPSTPTSTSSRQPQE